MMVSMRSASRAQTIAAYPVLASHLIAYPASAHKTKLSHASCHNARVLASSSIWQTKQIASLVVHSVSLVSQMPLTV
jgi:hypothetical protein